MHLVECVDQSDGQKEIVEALIEGPNFYDDTVLRRQRKAFERARLHEVEAFELKKENVEEGGDCDEKRSQTKHRAFNLTRFLGSAYGVS